MKNRIGPQIWARKKRSQILDWSSFKNAAPADMFAFPIKGVTFESLVLSKEEWIKLANFINSAKGEKAND